MPHIIVSFPKFCTVGLILVDGNEAVIYTHIVVTFKGIINHLVLTIL